MPSNAHEQRLDNSRIQNAETQDEIEQPPRRTTSFEGQDVRARYGQHGNSPSQFVDLKNLIKTPAEVDYSETALDDKLNSSPKPMFTSEKHLEGLSNHKEVSSFLALGQVPNR